jgi:hypothetical protein
MPVLIKQLFGCNILCSNYQTYEILTKMNLVKKVYPQ